MDPDAGSRIRCFFDPWIRDPEWVKNQDLAGSRMRLETIFWVKILKVVNADPDPRIFLTLYQGWEKKIRIRNTDNINEKGIVI